MVVADTSTVSFAITKLNEYKLFIGELLSMHLIRGELIELKKVGVSTTIPGDPYHMSEIEDELFQLAGNPGRKIICHSRRTIFSKRYSFYISTPN